MQSKLTEDGLEYRDINDKGSVPALGLPDGSVLTETTTVLQYIADQAPEAELAPRNGSMERYRLQEWLNYLATEIHKRASILVNPMTPEGMRAIIIEQLNQKLLWLDAKMQNKVYLVGDRFTVADAHLFFVLHGLSYILSVSIEQWPQLARAFNNTLQRPAVRKALGEEGLTALL